MRRSSSRNARSGAAFSAVLGMLVSAGTGVAVADPPADAPAAGAPATPAAEPAAAPLPSVDDVLSLIRDAAKTRVLDVRAVIFADEGQGPKERERITLHLDATGAEPRLRLDFGSFHIAAEFRRIVAIRDEALGKYVESDSQHRLTPRELLGVLPALPLPHLPLVLGDARWEPSDAAFCLGATFERVERDPDGLLRVAGASRRGPVTMWIDEPAASIVRIEGELSADGARRVIVRFEPAPALEPGGWRLPTDGRQRVPTLAHLRAGPKSLAVGDSAESIPLLDSTLEPASLAQMLRETRARLPEPRGTVGAALLVFRVPTDPAEDEKLREQLRGIASTLVEARRTARSQIAGESRRSSDCPVVVVGALDVKEFSRERLAAFAAAWEANKPASEALWPLVAWSVGSAPLDRLTSGAGPKVVIAGEDLSITSIDAAEGRDAAAWSELLTRALLPKR